MTQSKTLQNLSISLSSRLFQNKKTTCQNIRQVEAASRQDHPYAWSASQRVLSARPMRLYALETGSISQHLPVVPGRKKSQLAHSVLLLASVVWASSSPPSLTIITQGSKGNWWPDMKNRADIWINKPNCFQSCGIIRVTYYPAHE